MTFSYFVDIDGFTITFPIAKFPVAAIGWGFPLL